MTGEGSFLVEDFINAITAQLDRVQDALRLKAVNRPLTYALKDLSLDLQVFVEMDAQGGVKFRTSSPNETGASTVHLSFTTITKPMIEENTISLAMTRSPLLDEIGFDGEERRRLEQLGVRNAAQLERLGSTTGAKTVSRLSGIPMDRLRQAISQSQPQLTRIKPEPAPVSAPPARRPSPSQPEGGKAVSSPIFEKPGALKPKLKQPGAPPKPSQAAVKTVAPEMQPALKQSAPQVIRVNSDTRRLQLFGNNLIGEKGAPLVRLNKQALNLAEADDERLIVELPEELSSGALEIEMPDGRQLVYGLSVAFADDAAVALVGEADEDEEFDPWRPR